VEGWGGSRRRGKEGGEKVNGREEREGKGMKEGEERKGKGSTLYLQLTSPTSGG